MNHAKSVDEPVARPHPRRVPWTLLAPLALFAAIAILLGIGLTLNPREVPSPLIGKPVPEFSLPPVKGRTLGLASADLRREAALVNVFASWCSLASAPDSPSSS